MRALVLEVLGISIRISCNSSKVFELLHATYQLMSVSRPEINRHFDLEYEADKNVFGTIWFFENLASRTRIVSNSDGEFISKLDSELCIQIQLKRPELYFVHAAVLERNNKALLLCAESGSGKSTTAWALLNSGYRFLSDELAPIEIDSLGTHSFPRSLCLKAEPPSDYPLPEITRRTRGRFHVLAKDLPLSTAGSLVPVAAVFFVQHIPDLQHTTMSYLTPGEAALRLHSNVLNALAHQNSGLVTAKHIALKTPSYKLDILDLRTACELISKAMSEQPPFTSDHLKSVR